MYLLLTARVIVEANQLALSTCASARTRDGDGGPSHATAPRHVEMQAPAEGHERAHKLRVLLPRRRGTVLGATVLPASQVRWLFRVYLQPGRAGSRLGPPGPGRMGAS